MGRRLSLLAMAIAIALSLAAIRAYAATANWSQHQCNVVAVTYARTNHTSKAAYKAYLKKLNKLHGCKFKV